MKRYNSGHDILKGAALNYLNNNNLNDFLEVSFPVLQSYTTNILNRDPDIAGDFLLFFYERLPVILERYRSRIENPFTAYLFKCMKFEFYNFRRKEKRKTLNHFLAADIGESYHPGGLLPPEEEEGIPEDEIRDLVKKLPARIQIVIRLYFGIAFDKNEGAHLLKSCGSDQINLDIDKLFEIKKDKRDEELQRVRERMNRLEYLIQEDRASDQQRYQMIQRWKHRLQKKLESDWPVFRLSEIARVLNISRSTVYRRFEKGLKILKDGARNLESPLP